MQVVCRGFTTCIDAADTNGDGLIGAGDSGACAIPPTTTPTLTNSPTHTPTATGTVTSTPTNTAIPTAAFPASGQTTSYAADRYGAPNSAVPDDGAIRSGARLSYVDNGDGTITDLNTGLMWEKKGDDDGLHDRDLAFMWSDLYLEDPNTDTIWDWLDHINAEGGTGFAGYSDWRVPNVQELLSIVDFGRHFMAADPVFNTGCAAGCTPTTCSCTGFNNYWSSTTTSLGGEGGWLVEYTNGAVSAASKVSLATVRAVRGGLSAPVLPATGQKVSYTANKNGVANAVVADDGSVQAGRAAHFADNGNGTITDLNTGLVWEKKSADGSLHDEAHRYPWSSTSVDTVWDWLAQINAEGGSGFAGYNDWRLPNAKEMLSIAEYQLSPPAVPPAFNDGCLSGCTVLTCSCMSSQLYWSSTTQAQVQSLAWSGNWLQANIIRSDKTSASRVRAVRGGILPE